MDELLQYLITLSGMINNQESQNEESQLIREQFHAMENRYHTWMNYYSLFNGALLVAYCTLIVSTGKVIQQQCNVQTIYKLESGYWGFLTVIALLGVVASYCWLLSMIGHYHWLDSWRKKLQNKYPRIMKDISVNESLTPQLVTTICGKRRLHDFYSTAKITKVFIGSVVTTWVMILIYTISQYVDFNLSVIHIVSVGTFIILILYLARHILYIFVGSNLNEFSINNQTIEKTEGILCGILRNYLCSSGCHIIKILLLILSTIVFFLFLNQDCCIHCFLSKIGNALICY